MQMLSRERGARDRLGFAFYRDPHNASRLVLWQSPGRERVAAGIAVAGNCQPPDKMHDGSWGEMAEPLAGHFEDVDLSFVNFEGCLDADELLPRPIVDGETRVSAPSASLDYLTAIRTRVTGIANQHAYDFGTAGVEATRSAMLDRNIVPLGAGKTLRKAPQAWVWRGPGNIRVGFWAAARASSDAATKKKAGVEVAKIDRALYALECMRYHQARFCVAMLQGSRTGSHRPDPNEAELMDSLAEWGFDLVVSAHSGRVSGVRTFESHRGGRSHCFYGLGNLATAATESEAEREGLIVTAGLNVQGELARLALRPVTIGAQGFGEIAGERAGTSIMTRVAKLSEEIADGSYQRRFRHDVRQNLIEIRLPEGNAIARGLAKGANLLRAEQVRQMVRRMIG